MKKFILILCTVVIGISRISAAEQFIYTQISQKEGLTSTVNCIYKEKDGNVWLGTPNGLYRFNGYTLKHYDDEMFRGRRVFHISEDSRGDLWVLTNRWMVRRKKGEDSFREVRCGDVKGNHLFYSMHQDDDGIWFGSNGKLFRYRFSDDSLKVFKEPADRASFLFKQINSLDEYTLLCSSHNGIILMDTRTGVSDDAHFGSHSEVTASMTDSDGNIWLAFYNNGLEVYDREGRLIKSYNTGNSSLSNDIVLCLTERESHIWAGTDGGGVNIIDPETGEIKILSHISGDPTSFPAHSIKSIHTDNYGNVWVGSIRDGLICISSSEMHTYFDNHFGQDKGLSNPTVLCLHQSSGSDCIWIGTDGEGLNRFDPDTHEFTHYPATRKTKVASIADYSEDKLVLSAYSDRIYLFDKQTGHVEPLELNDRTIDYQIRYAGRSVNLANETDSSLLLISNVIHRLDKRREQLDTVMTRHRRRPDENLSTIGHSDGGIWLHDNYDIYHLKYGNTVLESKGHIENCAIRSGYVGNDGDIWLATEQGLCHFDSRTGDFNHILTPLFSNATSVVCDNKSRVWIGTEQHLYAYLIESGTFTMLGVSDGAAPNEFLSKPRLRSSEGDVYMGGVQGLLHINETFSIGQSEIPELELYDISADGVFLTPERNSVYEIPRHSKTLKLNISTREKDIFRNKMYMFSISGAGTPQQTNSPSLNILKMPKAGKYDISVSCTMRNGDWTDPVRIATIKIRQPWYLSIWFVGSAALLLLIALGATLLAVSHKKTNRLQLALKEQEQRIYEEKVRMLINISHELRTPLTLIMAPLKRIIKDMSPDDDYYPTLGRVYRQSRRMRDLLNMVLDLRKMEVGKNNLRIERVHYNSWLEGSIADLAAEEMSENINITTDLDQRINLVDLDTRKCDTVLMNIMINAVKHSSAGDTITIKTRLTEDGMVRTCVSDQGPGLGDIDPDKMFTRFYQSNSEQYGSGIGLSYSRILVEMHKGRIGAENNPDKGATFWWEIPLTNEITEIQQPKAYLNEVIGNNPTDEMKIPEGTFLSTADKKLMIVDDSQDLVDFLREAMAGDFAEIMTAGGGDQVLDILSHGYLPDIIVSDINMPEGDGYTLCSRLKSDERYMHIPVILLTARGEEQSQGDVYKVGADAYMPKPFETETLLELIRNLLRHKENIRKRYFDSNGEAATGYGSTEEGFILRLNAVIAEHIGNPDLDQQLLCRELGVSRALLYNRMKAITGTGTKDYITRIRLEKAKNLIETTNLPIVEISEMTGFTSQSYFSTAFKTYTGMTPSQYKKEHKSRQQ